MGTHRDPNAVPQQFDDSVIPSGPRPGMGLIAPDVHAKLPGLELLMHETPITVTTKSPAWSKQRLRFLSTQVRGGDVLHMAQTEAASAFRTLYKSIGREPNDDPPPLDLAYHQRLQLGGYPHIGLPTDAMTITLAETGIPVWAVDAELVSGTFAVRRSERGEIPVPAGVDPDLTVGQLVVADEHGVIAELCRDPRPVRAVDRDTTHAVFYAVKPEGITELRVQEAFWMCMSMLEP